MAGRDSEEERLFPGEQCASVITELNAWTSVQAILVAARGVESRGLPEDQLDGRLIMPMPHGPLFEAVFLRAIGWMVESYRVPESKILIARAVDPIIADKTEACLRAARFRPKIIRARRAVFDNPASSLPESLYGLFVDDEPVVIELVASPLRCLMDILTFSFESARDARNIRVDATKRTGGGPTIFHRPFADSRLYAMLEALCYFAHDLEIGPFEAPEKESAIDVSYRSVNVRCRPPVDAGLFDLAHERMEEMLRGLH